MMKWIWPAPKREPMVVSQDGLGGAIDTISRSVAGGLLLPFLAYTIGNVCFKSVNNHLRRVILVSWNQYWSRWPVLLYVDTLELWYLYIALWMCGHCYSICLLNCECMYGTPFFVPKLSSCGSDLSAAHCTCIWVLTWPFLEADYLISSPQYLLLETVTTVLFAFVMIIILYKHSSVAE